MQPTVIETPIAGLLLFQPAVFTDQRGYFTETYNEADYAAVNVTESFVQDNQSLSHKDALRGLHFQKPPHAQAKLVRVIIGSVLDVVVDIRKGSPTYGNHYTVMLSGENLYQLYIPEGFAHGFVTLSNHTVFAYKCSRYYNKNSEAGLMWNDPALHINWGINEPYLSDKDKNFESFDQFESPF